MRRTAFAASIFILWCAAASAQTTGWYAGVNAGASRLGVTGKDINGALADQGIANASTTLHTTDKNVGLEAGYRMSDHLAVEAAYESLGIFKYESTTATSKISGKYKARAASLAALGIVPLAPGWSFYGKAGLHYNTVDLNASSSSTTTPVSGKSESGGGWLAGVGVRYDFEGGLYTRVGWDHYARVGQNGTTGGGSIDLLQLALGMRF